MVSRLWNNKFKTLAFIIFLYVLRKGWLLYKTYIRPFLDVAKSLKGDNNSTATPRRETEEKALSDYYDELGSNSSSFYEDPQSITPKDNSLKQKQSLRQLHKLAQDKNELMKIKIFQSTLNTIKQSLSSQAKFISEMINKDLLNIYELKESTGSSNP